MKSDVWPSRLLEQIHERIADCAARVERLTTVPGEHKAIVYQLPFSSVPYEAMKPAVQLWQRTSRVRSRLGAEEKGRSDC